jgi:hypothetical protein
MNERINFYEIKQDLYCRELKHIAAYMYLIVKERGLKSGTRTHASRIPRALQTGNLLRLTRERVPPPPTCTHTHTTCVVSAAKYFHGVSNFNRNLLHNTQAFRKGGGGRGVLCNNKGCTYVARCSLFLKFS